MKRKKCRAGLKKQRLKMKMFYIYTVTQSF